MIELIVLAVIQSVVWGGICIYHFTKRFRKYCNRIPVDDTYNIDLDKIEPLPMYEPRLPRYDELPPKYTL